MLLVCLIVVSYRNSTSNHNKFSDTGIAFGVVSYRNSTSNHNTPWNTVKRIMLYLIEILHQTTTFPIIVDNAERLYLIEILHQTTTIPPIEIFTMQLYLIEILHQTTTAYQAAAANLALYLIEILHQTTTIAVVRIPVLRCILSKFYIKPQRRASY